MAALPDATASVRALAAQAGPVPAARRRGTLVLWQLRAAQDQSDGYLLAARDDAHTFYAQIALRERQGRWIVVQLTPPDFVQTFAPAGPQPPAPPRGSAAAQDAAVRFLQGYLPWLYGQAPLHAIRAATSGLAGEPAGPSAASPAGDAHRCTPRLQRSPCSGAAADGRRFRTSPTAARPTSSSSPSRLPNAGGSSATSAVRNEHKHPRTHDEEAIAMHEPSDGIAEELERQLQLALAAAAIAARRAIAAREQAIQQSRRESEQAARAAQARIDAERLLATERLRPVFDDAWWETAGPREIADMWQEASSWRDPDQDTATPTIFDRAVDRIGQEVRDRSGLDPTQVLALAAVQELEREHQATLATGLQ